LSPVRNRPTTPVADRLKLRADRVLRLPRPVHGPVRSSGHRAAPLATGLPFQGKLAAACGVW
jgi:hypothetical protein